MSSADLERAKGELHLRQRESYGRWLLLFLGGQLVATNVLMYLYAAWGNDWTVPNTVMQAWLGATVVQLIGVVYVVVSHLFPKDRV